jgi:signal transduction histidine kinase
MEAVGKLTGGLAHDFNNLLTVIIGNLVGLRDRRCSGPTEFIDPALNAAKRGAILIQRLLAFARQQPLAEEIVNVPKAIDNLMPLLRRAVPEANEILITRNTPNGYVRVDPNQLDNALLNLVVNARDAMPDGGRLTESCETRSVEQHEAATLQIPTGRFLQLQLIDTGIGMDPETIARAFEPFFTRKEIRSWNWARTVHGLCLCQAIGWLDPDRQQRGLRYNLHDSASSGRSFWSYRASPNRRAWIRRIEGTRSRFVGRG